mgnify:FL=1
MKHRDWFLAGDGQCKPCETVNEWKLLRENYRLYRFLTELEDTLKDSIDEANCLPKIRLLVRQFITNSYWLQTQEPEPSEQTGTSVTLLYDELGFPLTVQTVKFMPGVISTIHNHGTWGVIAILKGQEKNTFWKRSSDPKNKYKIERVGEKILQSGDLISLTSDAIHSVEVVGDEPTFTFNLYGETQSSERFEFDPITQTAKKF